MKTICTLANNESATFSADGNTIVLGKTDGTIEIWDMDQQSIFLKHVLSREPIVQVAISNDKKLIVGASCVHVFFWYASNLWFTVDVLDCIRIRIANDSSFVGILRKGGWLQMVQLTIRGRVLTVPGEKYVSFDIFPNGHLAIVRLDALFYFDTTTQSIEWIQLLGHQYPCNDVLIVCNGKKIVCSNYWTRNTFCMETNQWIQHTCTITNLQRLQNPNQFMYYDGIKGLYHVDVQTNRERFMLNFERGFDSLAVSPTGERVCCVYDTYEKGKCTNNVHIQYAIHLEKKAIAQMLISFIEDGDHAIVRRMASFLF